MPGKVACFTGHRPSKINKYNKTWIFEQIKNAVESLYKNHGVTRFLTGGAIGIDQQAAKIVIDLRDMDGLPIELYIIEPFAGFTDRWTDEDYLNYQDIKNKADKTMCMTKEPYDRAHYFNRNKQMVEDSDYIIAIWDGSPGGTKYTLDFDTNKPRIIINPRTESVVTRGF